VPENRDQGMFFNGSVTKRIVNVFIGSLMMICLHRETPPRHQDSAGTAPSGTLPPAHPTTTDTGNTVPQRANPTQAAYARSQKSLPVFFSFFFSGFGAAATKRRLGQQDIYPAQRRVARRLQKPSQVHHLSAVGQPRLWPL